MTDHRTLPNSELLLARFAERLVDNEHFMANIFQRYREQEGLTEAALVSQLGISSGMYVRLALCKRPSADFPRSAEQIRQIALYVGCDAAQLAQIIHQVDAMASIEGMEKTVSDELTPHARAASLGWLAAARDHTDTEDDAAPPNDSPDDPDTTDPESCLCN